jgi:hypothetical protein
MKFRPTFSNVRWNELSGCEAQALSLLIVDTLLRCQADTQLINNYIKQAVAEIQGPDFKTRAVALRSALILVKCIFKAFPKQVQNTKHFQVFISQIFRQECGLMTY